MTRRARHSTIPGAQCATRDPEPSDESQVTRAKRQEPGDDHNELIRCATNAKRSSR
jgi:hypothetical protein